jgi:hypothetical protein
MRAGIDSLSRIGSTQEQYRGTQRNLGSSAHNPLVLGSNPSGPTNQTRSNPETWVTECTGYMGNTICYLCLGSLPPVCARMDLLRQRIAGLLGLCKEPGRISAYPKPNRQRRVGLSITRTPMA